MGTQDYGIGQWLRTRKGRGEAPVPAHSHPSHGYSCEETCHGRDARDRNNRLSVVVTVYGTQSDRSLDRDCRESINSLGAAAETGLSPHR